MKLLLVIAVVLFGVWFWRSNRAANPKPERQKPQTGKAPLETVGCALCSVHISTADAVPGKKGFYCCPEHRQRAEL